MDKADEQPTIAQPLLPCPFCGEVCATLIIDQGDKWAHYEPGCLEVRTGYDISLDAPWRAEAIAAWNTRTTSLAAQDGLVEALQFYANHLSFPLNAWVQPTKVDYSLGGDGHWPDGPPIPSSALLADQGRIARKALSAIKEQHHD